MNKIKYPTIVISILTLLVAFTFSFEAYAAKSKAQSSSSDLYVSLGNLCEYIGTYQTDDEGTKNGCSFLPTLSGSMDYFLTNKLALSPQLGLTMPKSSVDENIKRMTLFALLNTKYKTNYVDLLGGVGLYLTRISGPGGEAELNNGNSTDSFPLPKEAVYTRNFIVNLGLALDFNQEWSGELYTYVFNALESEDRAFSVGATVSYHFGEVL